MYDEKLCITFSRFQQLFLQEEISFKALEKQKVTNDLKKLESDLKSVTNFIDRNHAYNKLINGNTKTIKRIKEVQNYKL